MQQDTLSFTRAFSSTKRLVVVNGTYQPDRDNWTLVACVNSKIVETRNSSSAHEDAVDMLEAWGKAQQERN